METSPPLYHWIDRFDTMRANRRYGVVNDLASGMFGFALLLLLTVLPVPEALGNISKFLDWATLLLLAVVVYYFILSLPLALALLPVVLGIASLAALAAGRLDFVPALGAALLFIAACLDLVCQKQVSLRSFVEFAQLSMLLPLWRFHHAVQRKP